MKGVWENRKKGREGGRERNRKFGRLPTLPPSLLLHGKAVLRNSMDDSMWNNAPIFGPFRGRETSYSGLELN